MTRHIKYALIGAIAGFLFGAACASANAAPSPEEDNNRLEQLVGQNNACRLVVWRKEYGAVRLFFPNKEEAQEAVNRLRKQFPYSVMDILSPDCDGIELGN